MYMRSLLNINFHTHLQHQLVHIIMSDTTVST